MKIDWLKPLLGHPGPLATVYIDATRANEAGDREVENRWKGVRRQLHQEGAPDAVRPRQTGRGQATARRSSWAWPVCWAVSPIRCSRTWRDDQRMPGGIQGASGSG